MLFIVFLLTTLYVVFHIAIKRKYGYWTRKNIPSLRPLPIVGDFLKLWLTKATMAKVEQSICQQLPDEPLIGAYYGTEPCLIVQDPHYIKIVTTKDFSYFYNRENSDHGHKEYILKNLFHASGDEWKILRQNLSPMFSSAKMKKMFSLIEQCSKQLEAVLDVQTKTNEVLEIREWMGRFTLDCIGCCAFGINTLVMEEGENLFHKIGNAYFRQSICRFIMVHARAIWPTLFYSLGLEVIPKQQSKFFMDFLSSVYEKRKEPSTRNDFIDMLMTFKGSKYIFGDSMSNLSNETNHKSKMEVNNRLLSAQCFVFFLAGYETSATTASFTLYELAKDQDSQDRVRVEIDEFLKRHKGVLNYECVNELKFLEQCVDEALRLYPVLGVITREVTETYEFADVKLTLEKGTRVHLPVLHMHRNPKYFSDPNTFRPDRFSSEEKRNIIPYTYFPFGEGPRNCIGMRFAKMQVLAGLVTVLKKYRVQLANDTPMTIEIEPKSPVTLSKEPIYLKVIPRDRE